MICSQKNLNSLFLRSKEAYLGQSIQEWTKENLWQTAFKKFEGVWSAWYGLPKAEHTPSNFVKAVFHKFYLDHY